MSPPDDAPPRLWLISDLRGFGIDPTELLRRIKIVSSELPPGLAGVWIREKHLDARRLLDLVRRTIDVCRPRGVSVAVSGRADVALAAGADAVHLGADAPSAAEVRRLVGKTLRIGVAFHRGDIVPVDADWAFASPVFPTSSKPNATPLGLDGLRRAVQSTSTPMVALGGVSAENTVECIQRGTWGVAVRDAVLGSTDVRVATRAIVGQLVGPLPSPQKTTRPVE